MSGSGQGGSDEEGSLELGLGWHMSDLLAELGIMHDVEMSLL